MKTPSDELFQLIKSLTPLEKRYFKLYSSIQGSGKKGKDYLHLFDIIDRLDGYNEEKLKVRLKNKEIVNNLKFFKSYLSEAILKSLEKYHSKDSVEIILAQSLQRAEILLRKRLYSSTIKTIKKGLKIAVDHEKFLFILLLLSWKRKTLKLIEKTDDIKHYAETGFPEDFSYLSKYKNQLEFEQLHLLMVTNELVQPDLKNKAYFKKISAISSHPLLQDAKSATSYESANNYYKIMGISTRAMEDWKASCKFRKKNVEFIEQNKSKLVLRKHDYIQSINNLLTLLDYLNKQEDFYLYYNKATTFFDSLPEKERTKDIFHDYLITKLSYISYQVRRMNNEATITKTIEVTKLMKENSLIMESPQSLFFYYFSFHAYFCINEYRNALKYLNKIMRLSDKGILQGLINSLRLFTLIVHYELDNSDLLISMSRSVRKFLSKRGRLYEFEELVLDLFGNKIHTVNSKKELLDLFIKTKKKVSDISKSNNLSEFLNVFDFASWLDSKIQNRSFVDVLKEKLN
ncbi:MAG: hypothetical protein HYU69_01030 [Bacteroidetes bacterium]|nr:hypothetical protein [Bacteroidota bacterium]